jgi:hypothetical protein
MCQLEERLRGRESELGEALVARGRGAVERGRQAEMAELRRDLDEANAVWGRKHGNIKFHINLEMASFFNY